jgi:glycosyltransferase involved in cell wall biosynthesis
MTASKRVRWLMLATHVPPSGRNGGVVRYTVEVARALRRRDDVELGVVARRSSTEFFADLLGDERRVLTIPDVPTPVASLIERHRPPSGGEWDVVHGTKHLVPRAGDGHRLLMVHDMMSLDRPLDYPFLKRHLLRMPYLRALREADTLVCNSIATMERLCSYVPSARPRSHVVPLAVSPGLLRSEARPIRELEGRRFVLVVGDASPRKNVGFLVDLWPEVVARHPDAVLVVAESQGWSITDRGGCFDELHRRGLVLSFKSLLDEDLRWCYSHAHVVLAPSVLEGFGLPTAEAIACNAPLITSDDPALCEVSGSTVRHLVATDHRAWTAAICGALDRPRPVPPTRPVRTWDDVADETVEAVRRAG